MSRRLDTHMPPLCSEATRLQAEARAYNKIRQAWITQIASRERVGLSPLDADSIFDIANGRSQGDFVLFQQAAVDALADFKRQNPDKVRYSALVDWMDETMDDRTRAMREAAALYDNPKLAYFDTETTGLRDQDVPWSAAACDTTGISLLDIRMKPLDAKGSLIEITNGASIVTGVSVADTEAFIPLEDLQASVIGLEGLMEGGFTLAGYNTTFDRQMICRALYNATQRVHGWKNPTPKDNVATVRWAEEKGRLAERLSKLSDYYGDISHWLELKDLFVAAIGLDPSDSLGRRTRLQDVGTATGALKVGENQQHGALANCQLLADIVIHIRKDLNHMADEKTPKKTAKPKGPFPPAANPAEKPDPAETVPTSGLSVEMQDYIAQLENDLGEGSKALAEMTSERDTARNEATELAQENRRLIADLEALKEQCAQFAEGQAPTHKEAREICFLDVCVNDIWWSQTLREGETVDMAVDAAIKMVQFVQRLKANDNVKILKVGLAQRDLIKTLKDVTKADKEPEPTADELAAARNEKAATPKGNGNAPAPANKPAPKPATAGKPAPAPAGPPAAPAGTPPAQGPTGQKKSQQCRTLIRHVTDGKSTFDLPFVLQNGKPAERPFVPSTNDQKTLVETLAAAGYRVEDFEPGVEYDLPIRADWTVGDRIGTSEPPKYYRNGMTFTIGEPQQAAA